MQHICINGFLLITSQEYGFLKQVWKSTRLSRWEVIPYFPITIAVKGTQQGHRVQRHHHHCRQEQLNLNHLSQELLMLLFTSAHTFFLNQPNLALSIKRGWMISFLLNRLPAVSLFLCVGFDGYFSKLNAFPRSMGTLLLEPKLLSEFAVD